MKSIILAACILILASTKVAGASNFEELDSIPMADGASKNILDSSLVEDEFIDNSSNKTLTLDLKRERMYQEVVQSHIFKHHMKVLAGKDGQIDGEETGARSIGVGLEEEHGMYYSTNVYVGSQM